MGPGKAAGSPECCPRVGSGRKGRRTPALQARGKQGAQEEETDRSATGKGREGVDIKAGMGKAMHLGGQVTPPEASFPPPQAWGRLQRLTSPSKHRRPLEMGRRTRHLLYSQGPFPQSQRVASFSSTRQPNFLPGMKELSPFPFSLPQHHFFKKINFLGGREGIKDTNPSSTPSPDSTAPQPCAVPPGTGEEKPLSLSPI